MKHLLESPELLKTLHHEKPTGQWKTNHVKMYLLLKVMIFRYHVSFQGGTYRLVYRDPFNGSLKSLYDWVAFYLLDAKHRRVNWSLQNGPLDINGVI